MQLKKISLAETKSFSSFFLDYLKQDDFLKSFYNNFPTVNLVAKQLEQKKSTYTDQQRATLVDALKKQYEQVPVESAVQQNIQALAHPTTFTVTTGHQLNIFSGPLYFIYKIVTVINACKVLKEKYPQHHFVPVYWMATEDHDYDEIKYFKLYGKKYVWETDQKGAVGRFSTKDMMALLNEVPGDIKIFREAYTKGKTLREATRLFVNSLFGKDGLVVVDGDDVLLKSSFKAVIEADVVQHVVKPLVDKTDQALKQHGYEAQIYSREINFFYLDENVRARIERKDNQYHVVDTQIYFSEAEMDALINTNPERFSPNVVLRPLYQEYLLPNVAYVGGPAEVIYWLQLKGVFDHFGVTYPMIMPRNFGLVVDHTITRKLERTGLPLEDFFEEKNYLFNHWVLTYSPRNLTLGEERNKLLLIFEELEKRAASVDQSLVSFVAAEAQRAKHSLETIEHKMLRAEKRLHKEKLGQIEAVKDALFPGGGLQERVDNFLNFYQQDDQFIERVKNAFDPFDFSFNVLIYDSPAS